MPASYAIFQASLQLNSSSCEFFEPFFFFLSFFLSFLTLVGVRLFSFLDFFLSFFFLSPFFFFLSFLDDFPFLRLFSLSFDESEPFPYELSLSYLIFSLSSVLDDYELPDELELELDFELLESDEESEDFDLFERLFLCLFFFPLDFPRLFFSSPLMLWMLVPTGALNLELALYSVPMPVASSVGTRYEPYAKFPGPGLSSYGL